MRLPLALGAVLCLASPTFAQTVRCDLSVYNVSYGLGGSCEVVAAETSAANERTSRVRNWPKGTVSVFLEGAPDAPFPISGLFYQSPWHDPFQIDLEKATASQNRQVIRTSAATMLVEDWKQTAPGKVTLVFRLNFAPATSLDVAMLSSALEQFRSLSSWNRNEDQDCGNDAPGTQGLFCLLQSAATSVVGRYHHAQPAIDIVRGVIAQRFRDRYTGHVLVDFNNHPATTADDLRTVLQVAADAARLESIPRVQRR